MSGGCFAFFIGVGFVEVKNRVFVQTLNFKNSFQVQNLSLSSEILKQIGIGLTRIYLR